jgi:hypothetical protein
MMTSAAIVVMTYDVYAMSQPSRSRAHGVVIALLLFEEKWIVATPSQDADLQRAE